MEPCPNYAGCHGNKTCTAFQINFVRKRCILSYTYLKNVIFGLEYVERILTTCSGTLCMYNYGNFLVLISRENNNILINFYLHYN